MIANNMDIIDLSSDSEDNIDDCSDKEDDIDSDDPSGGLNRLLVSVNTGVGQNRAEEPTRLKDDDWLNSTQASSSYWPAENSSAENRVNSFFGPTSTGLSIKDSNQQYKTLPLSSMNGSHSLSVTGGSNIQSIYHRPSIASAVRNYLSSWIPRSFDENRTKEELTVSHNSVQKSAVNGIGIPSSAIAFGQNPYASNNQGVSTEIDDRDVYEVLPPAFLPSHSSAGDIKVEPTVKCNGFQTSTASGMGMPSSTIPTGWNPHVNSNQKVKTDNDDDDVCVYGGPRSHRIFPPSMPSMPFMPSMASMHFVNNVQVDGFGMQSHTNLENRLPGCDERAVYEEALQHISEEKREEDLPEGVMSIALLKHQRIALAWMVSKENSSHCPGGILADDQGLGKTISTIALIQKERVQQSKFMSADLDSMKSAALNLDDDDDVVIVKDKKELKSEPVIKLETSTLLPPLIPADAESVATNLKPCSSRLGTVKVEPKKKTRVTLPSSASTLRSTTRTAAGTLVVCPASILKQWASELAAKVTNASKLSVLVYYSSRTKDPAELTKYDIVITTYTIVAHEVPKQNSDEDMEQKDRERNGMCPQFSIGKKRKKKSKPEKQRKPRNSNTDLVGGPLARVRWFRVVLDEAQTIKNYRTQVARACCGLKAKRRWCLSGTPIQNTIDDLYSYFRFLNYEPYSAYASFKSMIKLPISMNSTHGYKKLQAVLKIVLLRRTKETLIDGEPIIKLPPKTIQLSKIDFTQEERSFYMRLEEGSREKFKAYAAAGTIKENYANILVLLLRLRQACDHPLLLKGNHSDLADNGSIEMAKQLPKETVANLLEKLEGGYPICSICSDPPENSVVATCGHVFCYQCVCDSLTSDENVCPSPSCGKKITAESVFSPAVLRLCISDMLESDATTSSSTSADELSSICESSYISSKIRASVDIINSVLNTHVLTCSDTIESGSSEIGPTKAIVFSQWTGMLDLLELSLKSNLIKFRRLDGGMSLNLREAEVKEFNTDPKVRVMLMSLKAGNLGLNMVAACHVIMIDPWWNPYAEDQAVDRAHRIGQTRPVTVSRLTIKDTVEDRILALQAKKREMVQSAFGEDKPGGNAVRLTVDDLKYLFRI